MRLQNKADNYRYGLAQIYTKNYERLNESIGSINMQLKKCVYASSPSQMGKIAVNLSKEATAAMDALAGLPTGKGDFSEINKFLSQVGDYAAYLAAAGANGEKVTKEQRDNLVKLSNVAGKIESSVQKSYQNFGSIENWNDEIDGKMPKNFASDIKTGEEVFSDYPTLIYDGPFSDNIDKKESKLLSGSKEIDRETALDTAAGALGVAAKELTFAGEEQGKTPAFCFSGKNAYIAVTKQGGYVLYFRKNRKAGNQRITAEQAVETAKKYLGGYEQTLGKFAPSYYFCDEGVCTVNFAYKQGQTVCYTDLIKIGVALDSGEVVLMESRGYIMNHFDRSIVTPANTAQQAVEALSENLKAKQISLALIPTDGQGEVHCFECLCEGQDKQEVLVYLNVITLNEERILILLKSDGGTLVK